MKTFYGSIFIEKEKLREAGIRHPIKLEYYKMINEDKFINGNNEKYGVKIVKTEYKEKNIKIEDKTIKYLSNDEQKIDNILMILKENEVTPISLQDIICDFSKSSFLL